MLEIVVCKKSCKIREVDPVALVAYLHSKQVNRNVLRLLVPVLRIKVEIQVAKQEFGFAFELRCHGRHVNGNVWIVFSATPTRRMTGIG